MGTLDYWDSDKPSRELKRPIAWLLRHAHDVNSFECGITDDGKGFLMANMYRIEDGHHVQYARLHMTWESPGIMLRKLYRRNWNGVPFYWQGNTRHKIDTTRTFYQDSNGDRTYVGDVVVCTRLDGTEYTGTVIECLTGYACFDVSDKHGQETRHLRTNVRKWHNTAEDRAASGLPPECNYHSGDGLGTVCTCQDDRDSRRFVDYTRDAGTQAWENAFGKP